MGASFQFIVAGSVLVVVVGVALLSTQQLATDDLEVDAVSNELRSQSLLQVVSGDTWSWSEGTKSIGSGFGNSAVGFPVTSMVHLKSAQWDSITSNEKFDYAEARSTWGMGSGDDMHLRIVPVTSTGMYDLSGLDVAYIGDWNAVGTVYADIAVGDAAIMSNVRAEVDTDMDAATVVERQLLAALGADFDNNVHITAAFPTVLIDTSPPLNTSLLPLVSVLADTSVMAGDVYLDDPDNLGSILKPRLANYDVVVIGAGVDNNALLQANLDDALVSHVQGGGLLIQLGATSSHSWLQSMASAGNDTANRGLISPDVHHPVLEWPTNVVPEVFDQTSGLNPSHLTPQAFHRILGPATAPTLVVNQQGALANGTAIVTSMDITEDQTQGARLLTNMFAYYARQDLFLEFGPSIPEGEQVAAATRTVWGDDGGGNKVALRMTLYFWE